MSVHIGAQPGDIAERVLLPGDPMRAKWIAETFLQDAKCYTEVRGMLGFTGTYQGVRVSVQGSGMGMPSGAGDTHERMNEGGGEWGSFFCLVLRCSIGAFDAGAAALLRSARRPTPT